MMIALDGGRVIAARGFVGARWQVGSAAHTFVAPAAADTVIAPEHRNSGLLRDLNAAALGHASERGFPLVLGLSASSVMRMAYLVAGWREVGVIGQYLRKGRPPGLLERLTSMAGDPYRAHIARHLEGRPGVRRRFG